MLHSDSFSTFFDTLTNTNDNDNKIQRRFTNQQIKSLETIFQFESKLEPRKKLQVAKDLGLQPRQVAIWFQNKRARWKSKQLERDYNVLKDSYDSLSSKYDLLHKENQSLTQQLKRLHEMMDKKEKSCSSLGNSSNSCEENNIEHDKGNMEKGNGDDCEDLECDQLLDGDTSNQWLDFWS